jgi:baculoviral IAP repeat-containing protein 6
MAKDEGSDGEDEEQTTAAVCLALDLSTLIQSLHDGLNLWTATLGEAGALQIQPQPAAAAKQQPAPAANGGRMRWWGSSSPAQPPAAAAPSAEAVAAAAQAQRYLAAMQPHRFIEADLLGAGHYFARDAAANAKTNAGGEVMRRRLKRITEELGALSTSLPLSWDSSILLAVHADRLDVLRAVLLPHPDTPYGVGAFVFDILLPPEYPDRPPRVRHAA